MKALALLEQARHDLALGRATRADFHRRIRLAALARAGLTEADAALAMEVAFDLWRHRWPWCWIPRRLHPWLFGILGRRTARRVAARMTGGGDGR